MCQTDNKDYAKLTDKIKLNKRPTWDEYFMLQAILISSRSTCNRLNVGAIITSDNQIIASGYNGSPKGEVHCKDEGCLLEEGHCIRAIHAEINAISQCARLNSSTIGATMYVTHFPCVKCMPVIIQSGIKTIKYLSDYKNHPYSEQLIKNAGVNCEKINVNTDVLKYAENLINNT